MIKGDEIIIYEDPITKQKPEGEAVLIKKLGTCGFWEGKELQRWEVRFIAGDWTKTFERAILKEV